MSDKYTSENAYRKNITRKIQIGNTNRKKYKPEDTINKRRFGEYTSGDTNREIQVGNKSEIPNQKIQIGKYQSEHTSRKNTNQKEYKSGKYKSGNTSQ